MGAVAQQKVLATHPAQHLTFFVGEHEYAVDILKVREVLEYEPVTRVPLTPACIRGVMNVRGSVVPVVDLAVKFGGGAAPTTMRTCVIVVELAAPEGKLVMGLIADAVHRVTEFGPEELLPPPPFGTPIHIDYLEGMGNMGKTFALILDIEKVLSTEELLAVAAIEPSRATGGAVPAG